MSEREKFQKKFRIKNPEEWRGVSVALRGGADPHAPFSRGMPPFRPDQSKRTVLQYYI